MTKTLTENKWFYTENGIKDASWNIVFKSEVLAPVPSYDEYKRLVSNSDESSRKALQLEKKLEIALDVLGIIAMHSKDTVDAVQAACAISQIKEMEGVK